MRFYDGFSSLGEKAMENKDSLELYKIDPEYIKFLHKADSRVSVKYNNRPFVGVITMINDITYVLPLSSQTTAERKMAGKNKRASVLTTFVKDSSGKEIANILHNNMFPVKDGVYSLIDIDPAKNTYESNEVRYIRKNKDKIIAKAQKLHDSRINQPTNFLLKTCCDFKKLENVYQDYSPE